MHNTLITIIIPAYNTGAYLYDCIKSVTSQTYDNLEIVVVNDGSTDNSSEIAHDMAELDGRITVIDQENAGVSAARNTGLEASSGKYVIFIDSDDWIDRDMVRTMVGQAVKNDIDVVACGMRYVRTNGRSRISAYRKDLLGIKLKQDDAYSELVSEISKGGGSLCCKLIRRTSIGSTKLKVNMRMSEDQEWLLRIYQNDITVMYIPDVFYNVRIRQGSATTKSLRSDIEDMQIVDDHIRSWARDTSAKNRKIAMNALGTRARLQYSAAIRAKAEPDYLLHMRSRMIGAHKMTAGIGLLENLKYSVTLLPPSAYVKTRKALKLIKREYVR